MPNEPHRARSEQHRADLEAVLGRHFEGAPVAVRLVVEDDGGATPAPRSRRARLAAAVPAPHGRDPGRRGAREEPGSPDPPLDDAVDLADLVDAAPADYVAPLDRLTQAFPGAELLDEG